MRIVNNPSNLRDYYDIGLSTGINNDIVYRRKKEVVYTTIPKLEAVLKLLAYASFTSTFTNWKQVTLRPAVVGFCGKLYIGYVDSSFALLCTADAMLKYLKNIPSHGETLADTYINRPDTTKYGREWLNYNKFIQLSAKLNGQEHLETFITYQAPIFCYEKGYGKQSILHLNPTLVDTGFPALVDAYTAYQELSMFVGGVLLHPEPETVKITDDKYLLTSHGFDAASFKTKAPGDKKLHRKENKRKKNERRRRNST